MLSVSTLIERNLGMKGRGVGQFLFYLSNMPCLATTLQVPTKHRIRQSWGATVSKELITPEIVYRSPPSFILL